MVWAQTWTNVTVYIGLCLLVYDIVSLLLEIMLGLFSEIWNALFCHSLGRKTFVLELGSELEYFLQLYWVHWCTPGLNSSSRANTALLQFTENARKAKSADQSVRSLLVPSLFCSANSYQNKILEELIFSYFIVFH